MRHTNVASYITFLSHEKRISIYIGWDYVNDFSSLSMPSLSSRKKNYIRKKFNSGFYQQSVISH